MDGEVTVRQGLLVQEDAHVVKHHGGGHLHQHAAAAWVHSTLISGSKRIQPVSPRMTVRWAMS